MGKIEIVQNKIIETVQKVKATNPMVASITNAVTINFVANAQLAVGGSAAIVYLAEESELLAKIAGAFYINMGTLLPLHSEAMPQAAQALFSMGKAWVLDPVAVGVGTIRTEVLQEFKATKPNVIRGNASEIIALAGLWGLIDNSGESKVRGVDATESVLAAKDAAMALARWTGGAVAVSGVIDLITDGVQLALSYGGSHFMNKITGAGCSLAGVIGVYLAVAEPFIAALTASNVYNLAGKLAEAQVSGPGSFQVQFLDELYKATPEDIANNRFEIEEIL